MSMRYRMLIRRLSLVTDSNGFARRKLGGVMYVRDRRETRRKRIPIHCSADAQRFVARRSPAVNPPA